MPQAARITKRARVESSEEEEPNAPSTSQSQQAETQSSQAMGRTCSRKVRVRRQLELIDMTSELFAALEIVSYQATIDDARQQIDFARKFLTTSDDSTVTLPPARLLKQDTAQVLSILETEFKSLEEAVSAYETNAHSEEPPQGTSYSLEGLNVIWIKAWVLKRGIYNLAIEEHNDLLREMQHLEISTDDEKTKDLSKEVSEFSASWDSVFEALAMGSQTDGEVEGSEGLKDQVTRLEKLYGKAVQLRGRVEEVATEEKKN